jgi:hypothetical protein
MKPAVYGDIMHGEAVYAEGSTEAAKMTVRQKIYSILSTNSIVTNLVAANKIKTGGDLQGLKPPYIIHFPVALEVVLTHEGLQNLKLWRNYQVSCFGGTEDEAEWVAQAVIAVLGNYRGNSGNAISTFLHQYTRMGFDPDARIAHIVLDFQIAESL